MDVTNNITLGMFIGTQIILYLIGITEIIISVKKYKYSKLWVFLSLLFFGIPPIFIVYITLLEKSKIKKDTSTESFYYLAATVRVNIAVAIFLFYYFLIPLFSAFLKYALKNNIWNEEMAIVCVNIAMIALYPVLVYSRKRINKIMIKMSTSL